MEFSWTEEQERARNELVEFSRQELNTKIVELDRKAEFDLESWRKCAAFGIQGLPIPTEYGGRGMGPLTTLYMLEALGYGSEDAGLALAINAHIWGCEIPILTFGTESQKSQYLPGLCSGELIGALAAAEKGAGSDAHNLETSAEDKGDHFILNGGKMFVTNGPQADMMVVLARLIAPSGNGENTAFVVEKGFPGFSVYRTLEKMGSRTAPMGELRFTDCKVPASNLLGKRGAGTSVFRHALEWERGCILASAVGTMQRQFEVCLNYVRQRRQFGQPIGKFQLVASKLVDLKVRLETARLLLYKLGWLKEMGKPSFLEASLAKLYISECWVNSSLDAIQIHGGYGYLTENELERGLRDAVGSRIYSGTSEIQRVIIAKMMGL